MRLILALAVATSLTACTDPAGPVDGPLAPAAPQSLAVASVDGDGSIPGHYIVVADWSADARAISTQYGIAVKHVYEHLLNGFSAAIPEDVVTALAADPRVLKVTVQRQVTKLERIAPVTQLGATWGLDRIDQRALPLTATYTYDANGAGVTSYIIDTGIRFSHSDFGGRAAPGFDAFANDPTDPLLGYDGSGDCDGHGTHVAGTVGGRTWGVAKQVKLVSVRVLNCAGYGSDADVIAGMDWVARTATLPSTANMSLGDPVPTKTLMLNGPIDDAVKALVASGVSLAVAAGNGWAAVGTVGADACMFPIANVPEAITVAASTMTDTRTRWTNYGACIDLFAPGATVESATFDNDNSSGTKSGTSMAAPHVAGVASLILGQAPAANPAEVQDLLVRQATQNVVATTLGNDGATAANHLLYSRIDVPRELRNRKLKHTRPCTPRRQRDGEC